MLTFILWCILFVLCWPLALLALIAYPIVWLIILPFRIVGIAVGGVLDLIRESSSSPDACSSTAAPEPSQHFRPPPASA
jgi:hypothetical protein